MNMWIVKVLLFAVCLVSSLGYVKSECILQADNSTICSKLQLYYDKPAYTSRSRTVASIEHSEGIISKKTLQPFQDVEKLGFYADDINRVEDGALCSLRHLKDLSISHGNFPTLTKGILSECQKIKKFRTSHSLVKDSLYEMSSIENLDLNGPVTMDFNKSYLEPLKQLKVLTLETGVLKKTDDGLVCSSPVLEELEWYAGSSLVVSQSLFDGCNNLKKLHITGRDVIIKENPFANMPHLEELELHYVPLTHIMKDFLTGFPNLKSFCILEAKPEIDDDVFTNVPHLRNLSMTLAELKNPDLKIMHPLSELINLDLSGNLIESLDSLPTLPNLEKLDAEYNSISKFDFSSLKQKLPKLKELGLIGNALDPELKKELEKENTIEVNFFKEDFPI